MAVTIESLGIDRLSIEERLDLIEQIWDSLPDQIAVEERPEWRLEELKQRRERLNAEPGSGKPCRDNLDRLK